MDYEHDTTFTADVENAIARGPFDDPPINAEDLPVPADLSSLAQALEADSSYRVIVFQSALTEFSVRHTDTNCRGGRSDKSVARDEVRLPGLLVDIRDVDG